MRTKDIMLEARRKFGYNVFYAVLLYGACYTLILNIVLISLSLPYIWIYGIILSLVFLLLLGPINFGMTDYYLRTYKMRKAGASNIFDGFTRKRLQGTLIMHVERIAVTFLLGLLLFVPGIIYAINVSMAGYIMRANPRFTIGKCMGLSRKVMKGHRLAYFMLIVRFIPWVLVSLLTLGLGFIVLTPYYFTAKVVFYKRVLQGDQEEYEPENDEDDEEVEREIRKYEAQLRNLEKLNAMRRLAEAKAKEQARRESTSPQTDSPITITTSGDFGVTTIPIAKEKVDQIEEERLSMDVSSCDEQEIKTAIATPRSKEKPPETDFALTTTPSEERYKQEIVEEEIAEEEFVEEEIVEEIEEEENVAIEQKEEMVSLDIEIEEIDIEQHHPVVEDQTAEEPVVAVEHLSQIIEEEKSQPVRPAVITAEFVGHPPVREHKTHEPPKAVVKEEPKKVERLRPVLPKTVTPPPMDSHAKQEDAKAKLAALRAEREARNKKN